MKSGFRNGTAGISSQKADTLSTCHTRRYRNCPPFFTQAQKTHWPAQIFFIYTENPCRICGQGGICILIYAADLERRLLYNSSLKLKIKQRQKVKTSILELNLFGPRKRIQRWTSIGTPTLGSKTFHSRHSNCNWHFRSWTIWQLHQLWVRHFVVGNQT